MEIITVSNQGEIIIPQELREAYAWQSGQELLVIGTGVGILLTSKLLFSPTTLDEVVGFLQYEGTPKSIDEMEQAIAEGICKQSNYDF